ncbi:hypothetical protein SAMN05421766_10124 [Zobellia uliginosa]|uniref:Uncharacterized protein n=1 Tax=Zobellia uliginosa TaxID=143224 RepID=A0ABY1KHM5_9FLAO|nr:hypothetical protein SAMN05421766_10124 [Zobellia uliginosa]
MGGFYFEGVFPKNPSSMVMILMSVKCTETVGEKVGVN